MWPSNLVGQTVLSPYNRTYDLYSGSAGAIVFLLEAYESSGQTTYLATAQAAGTYLAAAVPQIIASGTSTGLYHGGAAGMAFALYTLYERTGSNNAALLSAYNALVQYIFANAIPEDGGDSLNSYSGLRWGTAGIGLFLLTQYVRDPVTFASYLPLAEAAGAYLIDIGNPKNGGLFWMSGFGNEETPNYAEGTSGVSYFLATLANVSGNATYLTNGALLGGTYLISVANLTGGRCIIYHDNGTAGLYYLANCHGPPGTGRFFLRAAHATGNGSWANYAFMGAQALRDLAPYGNSFNWYVDFAQAQPNTFWNNVGLCDGSSAAIVFFMTLFGVYVRPEDLHMARVVADDVLRRGTVTPDGQQMYWNTTEWRTVPQLSTGPQVGYMQGAAGVGSTLLWLDALVNGNPNPHITLPDDFFNNGWDSMPALTL